MLSIKNKKQNRVVFTLTLFLFSAGVFFLSLPSGHASMVGDAALALADNTVGVATRAILYVVFVLLGWMTSMAVTLFEWAINPNYISGEGGLLNSKSVYENWKFIRDFFNLFFILTLLYTAFTIVFQVAKDYKQTLLSLVLAAMFINFSFPITRVIIDVTNVPMYYFVNQMAAKEEGKTIFGNFLGASKIQEALIPSSGPNEYNIIGGSTTQLLVAIIMLFLFMISILVLAAMMVIRLVALLILLIFSSVGFAAAVIPGLQKYSSMWWDNLAKYALFGPASMLMLLIATRFFGEIANNKTKAQFVEIAGKNAVAENVGIIASMAMFSVPVVMMWFAIGLSSYMSLAGGAAVTGQGQKFAKWVGRKTYNNSITRGFGSGIKSRLETKFPVANRFLTSHGGTEAAIKGWTKKTGINVFGQAGRAGARTELQKLKDKQIHEQIGKDKENKLSRADAIKRLDPSIDEVMRISAATSLANMDNGIQSMDDLAKALDALKDPTTGTTNPAYTEKAVEIIAKADKKVIADTAATGTRPAQSGLQNLASVVSALGTNQKAIGDLINKLEDSAFQGTGAEYSVVEAAVRGVSPSLVGALDSKVRKEGEAKILVDAQVAAGAPVNVAVQGVLASMKSIKDIVAAKSLFQDPTYQVEAVNYVTTQPLTRYQEIKKIAAQESPAVFALI